MSTFLKLFVAFGLTWVFEVVAWLISPDGSSQEVPIALQIILNIPNVSQGVIIFFVFGLKRVGEKSNRLGSKRRSHRYSRSASTSSTTASTKVISLRNSGSSRVSTNPAGRNYHRSVSSELSASE